jgi:glyoxylase-like metal-dependent hydrolase (beta-lactamase superfamily II)
VTTRTAWLFARMLVLDVQESPVPENGRLLARPGWTPRSLRPACATERPFNFADVVAPLPLGFTRLAEGRHCAIGRPRWLVRTGHGHAPEHATLWSLDDDLVIGGDQLAARHQPNLGVYATEPEADPVADWIDSCAAFPPCPPRPAGPARPQAALHRPAHCACAR